MCLALSVTIYAGVSGLMGQPFHAGGLRLRYFDLRIYHIAALRIAHGLSLYGVPMLHHLGFTYPPFAALLMTPLAWAPMSGDQPAVTALNILLLVWLLRRALMLAFRRESPDAQPRVCPPIASWSRAAGFAAAALWLEPIGVTLGYGQIDLLIAALVVFDLSRPETARGKGVGIGLAAGIKLTPLLFIAYLLLSRRVRAAGVAGATFAATIVMSFVLVGHDAWTYWGSTLFKTSRIGNVADPLNQSLLGVIARLIATHHPESAWELLVAVIAGCGVALAAIASRRGDEAAGFSLAAISTLLASPISWPHHWTLAVPALVLLVCRARERASRALLAAAVALTCIGYGYLPEITESHFKSTQGILSLFTTDSYPLVALLALTVNAGSLAYAYSRRRRRFAQLRASLSRLVPPRSVIDATKANEGVRP